MRQSTRRSILCAIFALATTATTQAEVWVVSADGVGNFSTIQEAIALAADGDTILVRSGQYFDNLHIDGKSLSIVAQDPQNPPFVWHDDFGSTQFVVENLTLDQVVLIDGLRLWVDPFEYNLQGAKGSLAIRDCAGSVRIQNCELSCGWTWCPGGSSSCGQTGGAHVQNSQDVIFVDCSILAGIATCWEDVEGNSSCGNDLKPALVIEGGAEGTNVALYDCRVIGASGYEPIDPWLQDGIHGGDAAVISDSFVFASNTLFEGGAGSDADEANFAHTPGVGGDGGHAVVLSGAQMKELNCTLIGGLPGAGSPCNSCTPALPAGAAGAPGATVAGCCVESLNGLPRRMEIESNQLIDGKVEVTFFGLPGDVVDLAWSYLGDFNYQAERLGVLALDAPIALLGGTNGLGTIPASGELTLAADLPPAPSTRTDWTLELQSLFIGANGEKALGAPHRHLESTRCHIWMHCQSRLHSGGTTGSMGVTGTPSYSTNDLQMVASHIPPLEMGVFFYGLAPAQGWNPLGDGILCVAAPHFRLGPAIQSGVLGTFHKPLDLQAAPLNSGPGEIRPGMRAYFQCMFRDAQSPGIHNFNFTNGVTVEFCP